MGASEGGPKSVNFHLTTRAQKILSEKARPMGHFADLCPPRSRCSATCGTLFALQYDVYTISAGGHVSRFAIGSRSIGISISKVSTFLTFANLCPPRSRCSAMCGTLFALHYDVYTISAGGHVSRFAIGSRSIGISISKVSTFLTFTTPRHILVSSPLWFLSIYLCFSCFMKF